jgi:hypothetical protein
MTALHQFRGALTAEEASSVGVFSAREIKDTAVIAVPLVAGGIATVLGLVQFGLGNVSAALKWLVLAGLAVLALGVLGLIDRRRERKTMMQEIVGSIGPEGIAVIDRGLPILHEWSVVRSFDSAGQPELLTVWLSDDRVLTLSPRMFDSRLEFESATALVNTRAQQLG